MMHGLFGSRTFLVLILLVTLVGACSKEQPPVPRPAPPPAPPDISEPAPPPAPEPPPPIVPLEPLEERSIGARTLDELNRDSPLKPVFFAYDSSQVGPEAQATLRENAELLQTYQPWVLTIEGHCDERGTAEYNLALGERRALAVRSYLVSLGVAAGRLQAVSYGKEFPFDSGHDESAWAQNRRAHFVVTAK